MLQVNHQIHTRLQCVYLLLPFRGCVHSFFSSATVNATGSRKGVHRFFLTRKEETLFYQDEFPWINIALGGEAIATPLARASYVSEVLSMLFQCCEGTSAWQPRL
jgi:hypothetical protein